MKTILVPTDFSDNALQAMQYAIRFASHISDSHLIFFRSTDTVIPESAPVNLYNELIEGDLEENASELAQQVAAAYANEGITPAEDSFHQIVENGYLKNTIYRVIKTHNVDMIIMGTRGASGLKKVFAGSNTVDIIQNAHVPVLAVPANTPPGAITKIGYASDLTDFGDEFAKIVEFARAFDATVQLFHVYPVFPQHVDVASFDRQAAISQLCKTHQYEKIEIIMIPTDHDNDIVGGIEQYVEKERPSLLVMFTHERMWFDKIFNPSVSRAMAFGSKTPLLVFKK